MAVWWMEEAMRAIASGPGPLVRRRTQGGPRCHAPPLWPCNMLKPNFQSIIFQTNNGCSLLSLILAKLLL